MPATGRSLLTTHSQGAGLVTEKDNKKKRRERTNLIFETIDDAARFAEYDLDGNQKLDFEEFLAMQPKPILERYQSSDIKQWFDAADLNGDGDLSLNEFFRWSISKAGQRNGAVALQAAFEKYDADGTGNLEQHEFEQAASEMGYGSVANDLFNSLDHDGSGSVSYTELIATLKAEVPVDPDAKNLLMAMAWSGDTSKGGKKKEARKELDTTGWTIIGKDAKAVRHELQALLSQSGGHVTDLIKLFDHDFSTELLIDDMEFYTTMRKTFGYEGSHEVIMEVFQELDTDSSGSIGFDELYEFVRGRRHSMDTRNKKARAMVLVPPEGMTLDNIRWDVESLRILIQEMLVRCSRGPHDLFRAWDRDSDKNLTRAEFVATMYQWFFKTEAKDLWDNEVLAVADEAFDQVAGMGRRGSVSSPHTRKSVDLIRLERWLAVKSDACVQRKSRKLIRRQTTRRLLASKDIRPVARVDTRAQMRAAINAAKERATVRMQTTDFSRKDQMERWCESRATQVNGQRWELPPLQRWEMPRALDRPLSFLSPRSKMEMSTRTVISPPRARHTQSPPCSPRSLRTTPFTRPHTTIGLATMSETYRMDGQSLYSPKPSRMLMLSELSRR